MKILSFNDRLTVLLAKAILPIVLFSFILGVFFFLYTIDEKKDVLLRKSEVLVNVIGAVLRFDSRYSNNDGFNDFTDATISQLQEAFSKLKSGQIPSEYLIGAREGSQITFLAYSGEKPGSVAWDDSSKAVPMRLGLEGKSGIIVDNDYAGKKVWAVYRPIPDTAWALVVKQPIDAYMRPFYIFGSGYLLFVILFSIVLSSLLRRNERRHAREVAVREHRFQELVESTDQWVWETDRNGVYTYSSSQVYKMLGYRPDEVVGTTLFDYMEPQEAERVSAIFNEIVRERANIVELENYNLRKDGQRVCHVTNGSPFFDEEGNLLGYRGIDKDITKQKEDQQVIEEMAYSDLLTHLSNRRMSLQRLEEEVAYAKRHDAMGALLFIDLDAFKYVNDTSGHDYGDEVLIVVAERLQEEIRESDIVGRIGGDEFIVLLRSAPITIEELQRQSASLCRRIIKALNQPIVIHNKSHHVGASIGVAFIPIDGSSGDEVIRHADRAMYMAKERGKNRYFYYRDIAVNEENRV